MSPLEWMLAADAVTLIAVTIASGIAEARARRRAAEADWELLQSWLDDDAYRA